MKINREKLYELYMKEVENLAEVCDWVTYVGPQEIVHMIARVIEKNPDVIEHAPIKFVRVDNLYCHQTGKTSHMTEENKCSACGLGWYDVSYSENHGAKIL